MTHDTRYKETAMSEWGIGDYALLGEVEVLITAIDGGDCVYKRVFTDGKFGPETNGKTEDLKRIPAAGTSIPPCETVAEEVTKLLAENEIVPDDKPQPTWEQVLMIPAKGEVPAEKMSWKELAEAAAALAEEDRAAAEQPTIAGREMELAAERDDLAQKLAEALEENERLNRQLSDERLAFNVKQANYTEALATNERQSVMLQQAAEAISQQQTEIEQLKQPAVQSRLVVQRSLKETMLIQDPSMAKLADLLNEGWEVAFETIYNVGSTNCHLLRLERETQTPIYPPQPEARADVPAPTPEADPQPEATTEDDETIAQIGSAWEDEKPDMIEVPLIVPVTIPDDPDELPAPEPEFEPIGEGATMPPLANYLLTQSARAPQVGTLVEKGLTRRNNMQRQRGTPGPQYAEDAIPHRVLEDGKLLLGGMVIDPKVMPMAASMMQHGKNAVIEGLNFQIDEKVNAAMAAMRAQQLTLKPPPRTLGLLGS